VHEKCGANGLANRVPAGTAALVRHFLGLHNGHHLLPHLVHLAQRFHVHEVLVAPVTAHAVVLPLLVHVQQREVVALRHRKFLPLQIALLLPPLRPEERVLHAAHAEHGDNDEHLCSAVHVFGGNQHAAEGGIEWKFNHLAAHGRETAGVVEGSENPQLIPAVCKGGWRRGQGMLSGRGEVYTQACASICAHTHAQASANAHRIHEVVLRGRVHEVKLQQIIHAQRLEQQHNVAKVRAHDLRHGVLQQLEFIAVLGVPVKPQSHQKLRQRALESRWGTGGGGSQSPANAGARATRPPLALVCVGA